MEIREPVLEDALTTRRQIEVLEVEVPEVRSRLLFSRE